MADSISHDDMETRAQAALAESPILELRKLQVEQSGDALLISGRVDSFYYSQLAQEAVRAVVGRVKLVNSIDVG